VVGPANEEYRLVRKLVETTNPLLFPLVVFGPDVLLDGLLRLIAHQANHLDTSLILNPECDTFLFGGITISVTDPETVGDELWDGLLDLPLQSCVGTHLLSQSLDPKRVTLPFQIGGECVASLPPWGKRRTAAKLVLVMGSYDV
jgi:hypothetical protein